MSKRNRDRNAEANENETREASDVETVLTREADNTTPYVTYVATGRKTKIYFPKSMFIGGFDGAPESVPFPFALSAAKVPAAKLTAEEREAAKAQRKADRAKETPAMKAERAQKIANKAAERAAKLLAAVPAIA